MSREGQTLKWVRPNDLRDYPMPPADIPLDSQSCATGCRLAFVD